MRVGTLAYLYFLNLYILTKFFIFYLIWGWARAHPSHELDPPLCLSLKFLLLKYLHSCYETILIVNFLWDMLLSLLNKLRRCWINIFLFYFYLRVIHEITLYDREKKKKEKKKRKEQRVWLCMLYAGAAPSVGLP